ncbi:hypothetical protein MRS44_004410 [Fusarium solani]|uniref:Nucleoside phosphorylase domain-containing protein n=1 Tax=Fusarium solani TaxID=169388 RepID=A0A9P9KZM9_FUSSL|nr:nucleoside phosphorylase domain-containing protein [Fusarium solani]KAH7271845.1 nucleoside phosphorylase domain-containing protein [Fusarium solani]KAJ3466846.1 hypothetical protein MRS44_004410 [Fusarium solani]
MSNPDNYTVGWICAVCPEYVAARVLLDEMHPPPAYVSRHDNNAYTLGRIGQHNIAVAVMPDGEYGINAAAAVARDMMHSFPNVRLGLMVGIAGGVPSAKHDIRLGDVVVSYPRDGNAGVFQYDFGKSVQGQAFQASGFLNQPPQILLEAVRRVMRVYEAKGQALDKTVSEALNRKPRLLKDYSRPSPASDRLFRSDFVHPVENKAGCAGHCDRDARKLVKRAPRPRGHEREPVVHYGLVASGNSVVKNAQLRDKLSQDKDVLCFEMEAAGLMNHFPCLVIRGICDYSDSHKAKEWQGYAAMAAAAYARDILLNTGSGRPEVERVPYKPGRR